MEGQKQDNKISENDFFQQENISTTFQTQSEEIDQYSLYETQLNLTDKSLPNQQLLIEILASKNIHYDPQNFEERLSIYLQEANSNYQVMRVSVSYGNFFTTLNIANVDTKSPVYLLEDMFVGSFGCIHKRHSRNGSIAIKAIKITDGMFASTIKEVIKQYFLLQIASALRIGPATDKIFGFDIVAFRDFICFSMEFCDLSNYSYSRSLNEINRKLYLLHTLRIVHLDIKPQNIAYSYRLGEYVFIDFGLSKVIKEPIGCLTLTAFTGSFNFCSKEMLHLYITDTSGPINMYYNDAYSLNTSIKYLGRLQPQFSDEIAFVSTVQEYEQCETLINIKYAIFQMSFSLRNYSQVITQNKAVMARHKSELKKFVLSLSKSFKITQFYKQWFDSYQTTQQCLFADENVLQRNTQKDESIPPIYIQRKAIMIAIKEDSSVQPSELIHFNQSKILFDRQQMMRCDLSFCMLVLINFIKITNNRNSFDSKIAACKNFNEIYMKDSNQAKETQIYKSTIRFILQIGIANQQYQTIKNTIQTAIILEVISEQQVIQFFQQVLDMNTEILIIMRLVLQFVISFQFTRDRFESKYQYKRLYETSIRLFQEFLTKTETTCHNKDQLELIQRFRLVVIHRIDIGSQRSQVNMINWDCKPNSGLLLYIYQELIYYYIYNKITNQINRYGFFNEEQFYLVVAYVNKFSKPSPVYTYLHNLLFYIGFLRQKHSLCASLYRIFYDYFHFFDDHKSFRIYFLNSLNFLKCSLSKTLAFQRFQVSQKLTNDQIINEQVFDMLKLIVQKNEHFHFYLHSVLNIQAVKASQVCRQLITRIYNQNRQKILVFSDYDHPIYLHQNQLRMQINTATQLFQYPIETQEKKIQIIQAFIKQCFQAIQNSSCFQCKIFAGIQAKYLQLNTLHFCGSQEQSFFMVVQTMTFQLKNTALRRRAFPTLLNLIQRWKISQILFKKYDLRKLIYQVIKDTNKYDYFLVDSPHYNIFLHMYIYIGEIYDEDELVNFIYQLLLTVGKEKVHTYVFNFYVSIAHLLYLNKGIYRRNFIAFHKKIIQRLLKMDLRSNCYISLYFSALLQFDFGRDLAICMLKKISFSFNRVDLYSKTIMLNKYYYHFAFYFFQPAKNAYLCFKHLKCSKNKFSQCFLIKSKLKKKNIKDEDHLKISLLKDNILRYHDFIGNMT